MATISVTFTSPSPFASPAINPGAFTMILNVTSYSVISLNDVVDSVIYFIVAVNSVPSCNEVSALIVMVNSVPFVPAMGLFCAERQPNVLLLLMLPSHSS